MSNSVPLPNVQSQQSYQQQQPQLLSRQPTTIETTSSSTTLPPSSSTTSIVPSIIAGYASGICAVVVGHPMDSAKVWLQTNTNFNNVMTSTSRTMSTMATSSSSSSSSPLVTAAAAATSSSSTSNAASAAASVARGAVASTTSSSSSSVAAMSTLAAPTTTTATATSQTMIPNWRMVLALYAGVTGPLLTVGVVQSLNFAIYETARRELFHFQQYMMWQSSSTTVSFDRNRDSLTNVALAGATSGVFLSVVTAPILLVKTTSQVRGIGFRQSLVQVLFGSSSGSQRSATASTTRSITLLPSWYRVGFGIHSFIEILSRSVYYSTYEGCKRYLRSQREVTSADAPPSYSTSSDGNTLSERMISAAAAGIGCWAVIFPLDSIRSRIYAQLAVTAAHDHHAQQPQRPLVAWDMAKTMYQQGAGSNNHNHNKNESLYQRRLQGIRPFFRGFGVTVLRAGPVAAAALPVYDYVLEQVTRDYYYRG